MAENGEPADVASDANKDSEAKKTRSESSFRLLALAFAVTVSLLILIFILLWMLTPRSAASPSPSSSSSVCSSESCISAAALLQRTMDLSADPCQDFFSFACGGIQRSYPFTPESILKGVGPAMDEADSLSGKLFELLYNADLVRSGDPELNAMYQAVRDVFVSCIAWHDPTVQWLPHKANRLWQSSMKPLDASQLQSPFTRLIDRSVSLEDFLATLVTTKSSGLIQLSSHVTVRSINKSHLVEDLRRAGPILSFSTMHFPMAKTLNKSDAEELSCFCRELNISCTLNQNADSLAGALADFVFRGSNKSENFIGNLSQLQRETNRLLVGPASFSWFSFVKKICGDSLSLETPIVVSRLGDFLRLLESLAPQQYRSRGPLYDLIRIDAAMSFREAQGILGFAGMNCSRAEAPAQDDAKKNYRQFSRACMDTTVSAMRPIVYDMFKNAYLTDNFTVVESLVTDIENAMKQNVDEESWILSKSKDAIKAKMDKMKRVISYHGLTATELKSVFKNSLQLYRQAKGLGDIALVASDAQFRQELHFLTSETPIHLAFSALSNPFMVNAYYLPVHNSINILTGVLSSFMYDEDYPLYLLYGGIGSLIGHEIAHGFDPKRSLLDGDGHEVASSIFDEVTHERYKNKTQCLIEAYNEMTIAPNSSRVNGSRTVGNYFADIVGINAAFRAYRNSVSKNDKSTPQQLPGASLSGLTPDKLFFVQAVQFYCRKFEKRMLLRQHENSFSRHSPYSTRALGPMMQSKEFSSVFQCQPGDKMFVAESKKCHFW